MSCPAWLLKEIQYLQGRIDSDVSLLVAVSGQYRDCEGLLGCISPLFISFFHRFEWLGSGMMSVLFLLDFKQKIQQIASHLEILGHMRKCQSPIVG